MEEQIKKIYEKQKNGRIRMIRNVLLIYAALICVVSIFKGNPFPHQETVLFFDVKQPGWVTTDPWLLWICVVVDLIAGIFILIRDILRDFSKIDRILSQQCDAEKYSEMLEELIKYGKSLDYHGFQKSVMLIAESKYVVALIINGQLQKAEEYIKNEWEGKREGRSWQHDESRTVEEISGERCGRLFGYIRKSRESISKESTVYGKKFDAER